MQIQPHLRKIERSILSSSFHLKMLEEIQNYTEWSQGVWHKSPYKALCPVNAHKQVCHKSNSLAVLSLWLDCEKLRPFLQWKVLKFFTLSFYTLFLFSRSSSPWECLYLEKLPVATGRVNPSAWLEPCRSPKGLPWLCKSLLKAGWRTIRSLRKGLQKLKYTIWCYLITIISPPEIIYQSLSHTCFYTTDKKGVLGFKFWCSI